MANTATMYTFEIALADSDRNVYEDLKLSVAMQPSETMEFMAMRVLAFCLEYEEDLKFTKGLADPDEPAIWAKLPDGRIKAWIEVGVPDANRLHKAAKNAERVRVYAHRNPTSLFKSVATSRIHRGQEIVVRTCSPDFLTQFGNLITRRTSLSLVVGGSCVYLTLEDTTLEGVIEEERLISE